MRIFGLTGVMVLLLPLGIVAAIIAIVVGVARSADSEGGGENMIKNIYIYLVLFATLMMTIGGSVAAFMAVADIANPAPYYQSFEDYKRYGYNYDKPSPEEAEIEAEKPSEEELRVSYQLMIESEKERQVLRAKNSLIKSFGWIVIPFPIFLYYQRRLVRKNA